jgi:hypothetical protein
MKNSMILQDKFKAENFNCQTEGTVDIECVKNAIVELTYRYHALDHKTTLEEGNKTLVEFAFRKINSFPLCSINSSNEIASLKLNLVEYINLKKSIDFLTTIFLQVNSFMDDSTNIETWHLIDFNRLLGEYIYCQILKTEAHAN